MNETVEAQPVSPGQDKASGMAITGLILGIVSLCCCGFLTGIPAFIIGFLENGKIGRGESSERGKWMAITAIVLGIIGTILSCIWTIWYFAFGGLAVMQEMMQNMQ